MGGAESLGISKECQTVLARLVESHIWYQPASFVSLCGEGSEKGQWPLPVFLSRRKCPPALALMPDTSVPPHMPLVPFTMLPQCWSSEGVSVSNSLCGVRPFKRRLLRIWQVLLPLQPPLVLQPEVMETYLPGTGTVGWRTWCRAGTPHS